MNFLKSLFQKLQLTGSRSHAPTISKSFASAWLAGREDTLPGHSLLTSAYQQSTWVYACITTLAESVSAIPFRFVDSKGAELRSPPSDLERLFQQPHPQLDRFQFWELIIIWLCLRGEAFIYPIVEGRGTRVPVSLTILCPDHLHEVVQSGALLGWRYTCPGTSSFSLLHSAFLPEDLIHIKTPNPFNFFRGLSPLTVAWLSAQTDYAAAQFMKGLMFNNADTGLIVTTDAQISPEQREVIEAALRNRKRSAGTPDKPVFLGGGVKIEKPSISAVDLQFLENRKFNRQEICAIFKVPQELIGFTEDANRSVSDAMRLNFMENRVAPLCRRLEAAMQPLIDKIHSSKDPSIQSSNGGPHASVRGQFHLAATPIMQSAQRARIDTAVKLFAMGVPLNIINKNLDLGLPRLPHGDRVYLPTKLQEVGPSALGEGPQREPEPQEPQRDALADTLVSCLRLLPTLKTKLLRSADGPSAPNGKPHPRF
jgi:HK97 family phage portal protein